MATERNGIWGVITVVPLVIVLSQTSAAQDLNSKLKQKAGFTPAQGPVRDQLVQVARLPATGLTWS